jgi:hypothetical protein
MPELFSTEKGVGLHYNGSEKCFIDAAGLVLAKPVSTGQI